MEENTNTNTNNNNNTNTNTSIANTQQKPIAYSGILDVSNPSSFETAQRMVKALQDSNAVPAQFRDKSTGAVKFGDLLIALCVANETKCSILEVFQGLYIIHGNPAFSAKWYRTQFYRSNRYSNEDYVMVGKEGTDSWGCRFEATRNSDGKRLKGRTVTIKLAKDEGWFTKAGSKWQTIPETMLRNRAISWFVQDYCPDITLGCYTVEEVQDFVDVETVPQIKNKKEWVTEINTKTLEQTDKQPSQETKETVDNGFLDILKHATDNKEE